MKQPMPCRTEGCGHDQLVHSTRGCRVSGCLCEQWRPEREPGPAEKALVELAVDWPERVVGWLADGQIAVIAPPDMETNELRLELINGALSPIGSRIRLMESKRAEPPL